ncbi:uncharacterized protein UTRI_05272 [Ustilago trichophora]|uniref:Copper transport protein n=1 Tax=Ustilago trichophora TaxID=86804 RepID=A0A5C3EKP3_9BASI|nr:uncharacterized protein UTRI_05272 [Ustilago trichophora]
MDMSKPSSSTGVDDMEGWKPYLHTSLFSPFSNDPGSGEAFLFPTFRIYSRTTFLAACAFTFLLALIERWLTHLLDTTFSLNSSSSSFNRDPNFLSSSNTGWWKRKNSHPSPSLATVGGGSIYVNLPHTTTTSLHDRHLALGVKRGKQVAKVLVRNVVFSGATLLRYVLMIIGMGMDWALLVSVVAGLTVGHFLSDFYRLLSEERDAGMLGYGGGAGTGRGGEENVELLQRSVDDEEAAEQFEIGDGDEEDNDGVRKGVRSEEGYMNAAAAGGGGGAHRRSNSRQASVSALTPY